MNEKEKLILQVKIMREEIRHIRDYASELDARMMAVEHWLMENFKDE